MFSLEYKPGVSRGGSVICPISSLTMSQVLLLKGVKIDMPSQYGAFKQAQKVKQDRRRKYDTV